MNSQPMQVILGVASLKAYVTAPKAFHVLGIVRFGQEFGLLATDAQGLYFRVNGSHIAALDAGTVDRAIHYAYGAQRHPVNGQADSNRTPVPVLVRKHRRAVEHAPH